MTADAVGGVWTYARELIAALPDDVEVTLAVMGPPPTVEQRSQLEAVAARVDARRFALEWMDEASDDVERAGEWLLELRDESRADLVHLNGFAHAALPFGAPVLVVAHSCVLSWHEAVRGHRAGREWSWYAAAVARGLRAADLVVAPTSAMLRELERLYDVRSARLVIPNGRSRDGLVPLPKEDLVVGAGRVWDEAKNLKALGRVAAELPWPVMIVGEGSTHGRVDQRDLQALYGRAAIFAEPALYEPFGLAALEAGLCGCALVLGDIPSLREVWGEAAVFVAPGDDDALAAALRLVAWDDDLRLELGERARRRAARYTVEAMAAGYAGVYARVLSAVPA
jgi:glycogen synthase